jgi:hypothetical protein
MQHDTLKVTQTRDGRMFIFSTPGRINEDQATEIQMQLGYHPCGYGFYSFNPSDDKTTWKCGDSCD